MGELYDLGVRVFTDDGDCVADARVMRRAFEYLGRAARRGARAARRRSRARARRAHARRRVVGAARHPGPARGGGVDDRRARPRSSPSCTGGRYHVLHLSSAASADLVRAAKADGRARHRRVHAATSRAHRRVVRATSTRSFKMNPPLREQADVDALRAALARRHDRRDRDRPRAARARDARTCRSRRRRRACSGSRPRSAVVLTTLVEPGVLTLAAGARRAVVAAGARVVGLDADGHGGPIAAGRPANLCVIDPAHTWVGRRARGSRASRATRRGTGGSSPARSATRSTAAPRPSATASPPDDHQQMDTATRRLIATWRERSVTEALLVLADGETFEGVAVGHRPDDGVAAGEVVFNTALAGYQEILTDPSYAGQIITFTYPHIGNYGVNERRRRGARAALPRRDRARPRAPAVELARDRRSRRLPRAPRGRGHRRHRHAPPHAPHPSRGRDARARSAPPTATRCSRPRRPTAAPTGATSSPRSRPPSRTRSGPTTRACYVVAYDFGIKRSILDQLVRRRVPGRGRARGDDRRRRARPRARRRVPLERSRRSRPRSRRARRACGALLGKRAGVRHLPRAPDHEPRARRADVQAALRSPRRQPSGAAPRDRPGRDHEPEPQLRGRRATRCPTGSDRHAPQPQRRRRRRRAHRASRARSACSTTPKRVPVRTTRATCSSEFTELMRAG